MNAHFLRAENRLSLELKGLYLSYGYREYKLSGFEEYSLYAENKSFLSYKDVITFSAGGKLLALRPDVTLSVVKNVAAQGGTQKLFYDEKVYRKNDCGGFSEVNQIGVEVIGGVDGAAEAELVTLMLKTLSAVGERYLLDVSHIGVIVAMLDGMGLNGADRAFALDCLNRKDAHDFLAFAQDNIADKQRACAFAGLLTLSPQPDAAIPTLKKIVPPEAIACVNELENLVSLVGGDKININFSSDGDAEYYNGLIFKGYIDGVPRAVLSGGRYDKLLVKFGKDAQAMGFALYLGELTRFFGDSTPSPDIAVIYTDKSVRNALRLSEELRGRGLRVLTAAQPPENFKGKIIYAEENI